MGVVVVVISPTVGVADAVSEFSRVVAAVVLNICM